MIWGGESALRLVVDVLHHELRHGVRRNYLERSNGPQLIESSRVLEIVVHESLTGKYEVFPFPKCSGLQVVSYEESWLTSRFKLRHCPNDFRFREVVDGAAERMQGA